MRATWLVYSPPSALECFWHWNRKQRSAHVKNERHRGRVINRHDELISQVNRLSQLSGMKIKHILNNIYNFHCTILWHKFSKKGFSRSLGTLYTFTLGDWKILPSPCVVIAIVYEGIRSLHPVVSLVVGLSEWSLVQKGKGWIWGNIMGSSGSRPAGGAVEVRGQRAEGSAWPGRGQNRRNGHSETSGKNNTERVWPV